HQHRSVQKRAAVGHGNRRYDRDWHPTEKDRRKGERKSSRCAHDARRWQVSRVRGMTAYPDRVLSKVESLPELRLCRAYNMMRIAFCLGENRLGRNTAEYEIHHAFD